MLSLFRRGGTGQVIVGAVVFAIIVVFVLEFRAGRSGDTGSLSRECAVEVFDQCVDRKEYFAAYGLIVPRGMQPKRVRAMGLRKQVMEGLVERELLRAEAKRLGVGISEADIDDELATGRAHVSLPVGQVGWLSYNLQLAEGGIRLLPVKSVATNEFDYKIYERIVRNTTNRSPKEFKEMQRRELVADRMRALVQSRVRVSVEEAYLRWEREQSKAVARIVHLNKDWFAKYAVDDSDAAIDAWATANPQQVDEAWKAEKERWTAGCPLVSEILMPVDLDAGEEAKVRMRERIDAAAAKLKDKEPFERVARHASEAASASWGGAIGCLDDGYGAGSKELLEAVAKMKAGEVSPVLETQRGFHIIKLHGKLAAADVEKVGRRTVARRLAVPLLADEKIRDFANRVVERAKKGERIEEFVKEMAREALARKPAKADDEPMELTLETRPRFETSTAFNRGGAGLLEALPGENPAEAVFKLEKADDVVEKPIATKTGLAVLQLKEKTLAKRESFEKDRLRALRELREIKEHEALVRYLASLRAAAKDKIKTDPRLLEEATQDEPGDG